MTSLAGTLGVEAQIEGEENPLTASPGQSRSSSTTSKVPGNGLSPASPIPSNPASLHKSLSRLSINSGSSQSNHLGIGNGSSLSLNSVAGATAPLRARVRTATTGSGSTTSGGGGGYGSDAGSPIGGGRLLGSEGSSGLRNLQEGVMLDERRSHALNRHYDLEGDEDDDADDCQSEGGCSRSTVDHASHRHRSHRHHHHHHHHQHSVHQHDAFRTSHSPLQSGNQTRHNDPHHPHRSSTTSTSSHLSFSSSPNHDPSHIPSSSAAAAAATYTSTFSSSPRATSPISLPPSPPSHSSHRLPQDDNLHAPRSSSSTHHHHHHHRPLANHHHRHHRTNDSSTENDDDGSEDLTRSMPNLVASDGVPVSVVVPTATGPTKRRKPPPPPVDRSTKGTRRGTPVSMVDPSEKVIVTVVEGDKGTGTGSGGGVWETFD